MIFIGSKEVKELSVNEVYVGSTLVYKKYPTWYDKEFKSVALAALNGGKEMSTYELSKVTNSQFSNVSFNTNTSLRTIKDLEKFASVDTIHQNCFNGCTGLGTQSLESTGEEDDTVLRIPSNIIKIAKGAFNGCTGYKSIVFDHYVERLDELQSASGYCFHNMTGLEGVIDISNFYASRFHEFDGWGKSTTGVQIIMSPKQAEYNNYWGTWFSSAKVTALAPSLEELEVGKIKIPEGFVKGGLYSMTNPQNGTLKHYFPSTFEWIDNYAGGGGDWDYKTALLDIDVNCKYITGGTQADNYYSGGVTIVCRAVTPPIMGLGGIGWGGNYELQYPFIRNNIKAIYVPDESVNLYKEDTKYATSSMGGGINSAGTPESSISVGEGEVSCFDGSTLAARIIGWSRFASYIKPLSEYQEA